MLKNLLLYTAVFCCLFGLSACSDDESGSDNPLTPARIVNLFFGEPVVRVADDTTLGADIAYANNAVFDNGRTVFVSFRLPEGIAFEAGSARVEGDISDDEQDPVAIPCAGGGSLVVVNLDQNDLENVDDPSGNGNARLNIDVVGVRAVPSAVVEASAGYDQINNCDSAESQTSATIVVAP